MSPWHREYSHSLFSPTVHPVLCLYGLEVIRTPHPWRRAVNNPRRCYRSLCLEGTTVVSSLKPSSKICREEASVFAEACTFHVTNANARAFPRPFAGNQRTRKLRAALIPGLALDPSVCVCETLSSGSFSSIVYFPYKRSAFLARFRDVRFPRFVSLPRTERCKSYLEKALHFLRFPLFSPVFAPHSQTVFD